MFNEDWIPAIFTMAALLVTTYLLKGYPERLIDAWLLDQKVKKAVKTDDEEDPISVSGLFVHPIKSLRAVSTTTVQLDDKGFVGDRRFMLVYPAPKPVWKDQWEATDTTHRFLTQRQCPSLARVVARRTSQGTMTLEYQGKTMDFSLQAPPDKLSSNNNNNNDSSSSNNKGLPRMLRAGLWDDQVLVEDMGDEVASFFQAIVNADEEASANRGMYQGIRLVKQASNDQRLTDAKFTPAVATVGNGTPPSVALTDGFPILIASEASLNEVNRRLKEVGKDPISMSRFRPNIVLNGKNLRPFEEDYWKYILIGDQRFALVKACPRCKQSCTDQETGKVHAEPVSILKDFRALGEKAEDVFFAQNAIPLGKVGTISVGDRVRVIERGEPIYC